MAHLSNLREYYLRAQKYLTKAPDDTVARESFNAFLMSLQQTGKSNWEYITNPVMTQAEMDSVKNLYEIRESKVDRKSRRRNDDYDDMEDEYESL